MNHAKLQSFISNFYVPLILLASTLMLPSCKKEYPDLPYNAIEQFTIKDAAGNDLKASVEGTSVIIYYPPFQAVPDSITPNITVSEGATVEPASGSKVPFKDGTTFQVKAADGNIKAYTLKALVNQPTPLVEVGDTQLDMVLVIVAEYLLPDTTQTQVYLIDKQNKETRVQAATFTEFSASRIVAPLPAGIDTGLYRVKVISGTHHIVKGPIQIGRPSLQIDLPQGTVKRGGELLLVNTNNSLKYYRNDISVKAQINYGRRDFVVADVTVTGTEIKVKVPANYPSATISGVTLSVSDIPYFITPLTDMITVTD
jgi:hypothetical protein